VAQVCWPWHQLTRIGNKLGADLIGNRNSEMLTSGSTTTNTYNYPTTSNMLWTVTQSSTPVRSFTYDSAGNVTADDRAGTAYNYRYNNRARMDRLTIGMTVTADYVYDGLMGGGVQP
jgi:hypothetical protein